MNRLARVIVVGVTALALASACTAGKAPSPNTKACSEFRSWKGNPSQGAELVAQALSDARDYQLHYDLSNLYQQLQNGNEALVSAQITSTYTDCTLLEVNGKGE